MSEDFYDRYFHSDTIEYPDVVSCEILPFNVLYSYVSADFLNAFVNGIEPVKVLQIDRYTHDSEMITNDIIGDKWHRREVFGAVSKTKKGMARTCVKK